MFTKNTSRKISLIVFSLALLFILTGCNGGSDDDLISYDVNFKVLRPVSGIIENAEVVVEGETKYTDMYGLVNFENLEGECSYTISKAGYLDANGTVTSDDADSYIFVTLELLDETDPIVDITSPADGAQLGENDITIEWDITDDSPYTWGLYLGGGVVEATGDQDDPHTYTFDPADPDYFGSYHGNVTFRVEAVDEQDNASSDSVSVSIDTRADLIFGDNGNGYWWDISNGNLIIYVANDGPSTAGESTVEVYFYNDDRTEYIETPSIEPGENIQLPGVEMPTVGGGDNIYFDVILDVNDEVDESNENNNEDDDFLVT